MLRNSLSKVGFLLAATALLATLSWGVRAAEPLLNFAPFATAFNSPIGIDFFEPVFSFGQLVVSVNYPSGLPNNVDLIDSAGVHTPLSTIAGLGNEVKIATVRNGPCTGGFPVGSAFIGNGTPGQIAKINPDGSFVNPWAILPRETSMIRGSLYQDRACAFGGDLIVVTGNEQTDDNPFVGNVWRVNAAGTPTLVATLNKHLEGVITLPDDPKYGPLAGRIVAGDEDRVVSGPNQQNGAFGKVFGISPTGNIITVGAAEPAYAAYLNFPTSTPIHPEDLDLVTRARTGIPNDGDLFAVDFHNGQPGLGQILRASSVDFADHCGEILITQEFPNGDVPSGFSLMTWNPNTLTFDVAVMMNTGTAGTQFEHVTFRGGSDCALPGSYTLTKNPKNASYNLGDNISFTMVVTSTGPGTANNVILNDPLPTQGNLTTWIISSDASGACTIVSNTLNCPFGNLANGAVRTVTVATNAAGGADATACTGVKLNNTATLTGSDLATLTDTGDYICNPPSGKTFSIGPSSMEGAIKISNGDWVNGGYSFKTNFSGTVTVAASVSITGPCSSGGTGNLTFPLQTKTYNVTAGSNWIPTGDQNSVLSWQGSVIASVCGGVGQLNASKGAVFTSTVSGTPPGGKTTFRFKFRDPAAKGKPNTNCLDTSDPNRAKADVCGASWSQTVTDP
jgi:uncharacterized repeat protein (TIGR01451 family)